MKEGPLCHQLKHILGDEGFVRFCQALGGTRVYIPHTMRADNEVLAAVGEDLAGKLSRAMAPATIRVPLARADRARFYRARGQSHAQIARQLGMTETGVEKLLGREGDLPDRSGSASKAAQLSLL